MDFTLFRQFPPEIQLEVLKQCARNDLVCLSLTSHELRLLSTPLITSKPKLEWVDQLGSTADVPHGCPLDKSEMDYRSTCEGVRGKELHYNSWQHRRKRHTVSGRVCYPCNYYPDDHPECSVPYCKKHCLCISCPLFTRLRGWMGERKYCSDCRKFTIRHKRNKGRCMHGRRKVRKAPNNQWTHRKGLSYGRRWWRKWGTCNIDHEAYTPDANRRPNARVV
ncbi:F-box domain-containing protein [Fusarium flagelliforme]|uniref:F-box domain-containing protein n=1 Tax=Fusarium flagelliforme TaxID=2675880 RepID=UPI001E8D46A2|nr:F-box domain-containing protein [Fusarium flagelliforme]KAH7179098.1 F-box domain-containing protein [Fusarium flagelliforme]